jgi:phosphatidylglycerol lysyltransferase
LFLAFDFRIGIGPLVTTYAIGILTWIVSPAPQGTGVIEGAMVLAATTLGVPWNVAVTVTLAFRGLTFWLPVIWGFFMLRRVKTFEPTPGPEWEEGSVQVVAILIGWLGLINILMSIAPSAHDQLVSLGMISPFFVPYDYPLTEFLTGMALMIAANGLWRRKRVIWMLLTISLLVLTGIYIWVSQQYGLAFISLAFTIWLFILSPKFTIASDMPSIRKGIVVAIAGLAMALILGVGGVYWIGTRLGIEYDLVAAAHQTLVMFSRFYNPRFEPIINGVMIFIIGIYALGVFSFGYLLLMAMRPVQIWRPASYEERSQAKRIVEAYGRSSLAYLTLFEDKAYYFSPGGSVIAYTVQNRIALTLGDPIGPEKDFQSAIKDFRVFCANNDWVPAFCMALPTQAQTFRKLGFDLMCLGHEAVVDLEEFRLEGNANKNFRKRFNRLLREGFKVVIHDPPIPGTLIEELHHVSDEWLSMTRGSEKRFFLGRFDEEYLRSGSIAVVYTPGGKATAFTNLVPEFQLNELTIDLMRRQPGTESGAMDFLFVSLFLWAQQKNFSTFNLGLCALSDICDDVSLPIIQRGLKWFYEHGSWIYHFKGVYEFKDKFHPSWTPQYLMYPSIANLPAIWYAMILANAGEDDFPWKYLMRKTKTPQPDLLLTQPLDAQA